MPLSYYQNLMENLRIGRDKYNVTSFEDCHVIFVSGHLLPIFSIFIYAIIGLFSINNKHNHMLLINKLLIINCETKRKNIF